MSKVNLIGILSHNIQPDDIPLLEMTPPGFACFLGSAWCGSEETHPVIDGQIVLGKKRMNFLMSEGQAIDMIEALRLALVEAQEMQRESDGEQNKSEP